jgi:uncharacterized hydrophobic protein (TIGR00271 family)
MLTSSERAHVGALLFPERTGWRAYLGRFVVLMALSTLIATFGLASDSGAVVIGAMLVAPLMTPLLGIAYGLTMGLLARQVEAAAVVIVAAAGAIGLAWLAALTFAEPRFVTQQSHELLARTKPTTLDLSIALAAGAAGAYVTVYREAVAALPGAAIAVALIPPLATVGISLELGRADLAGGAMLLFLTNLAGIVLAASVTFMLTGVFAHREGGRLPMGTPWGILVAIVSVAALAIPLEAGGRDAISAARRDRAVNEAVTAWIGRRPISLTAITINGEHVEVDLAGPTVPASTRGLVQLISRHLHHAVSLTVRFTQHQIFDSRTSRAIR